MNKKERNITISNVIVKSHPNSLITIVPIDSYDFRNIFRAEKTVIVGTGASSNGFDFYNNIVVLQATVCDNYAVLEYMKKDDYYNMLSEED